MTKHDTRMLETAIDAVLKAGNVLQSYYGRNYLIMYKDERFDGGSIVTEADIASEKKLVEVISASFPYHNICAEEGTIKSNGSSYTWYIDPLDGTSNFSRNIPLFGISIGLAENGKPILGVLYFPALDLLVHAEKGNGAFANGKRIHVSDRELKKSLYYSGGQYKGSLQIVKSVADGVGLVKIIDASSYEFAQIAMGDAELYILNNVPHDVAAGVVIVREAGGKITDYDGREWSFDSKKIVASNGVIHSDVIGLLKN